MKTNIIKSLLGAIVFFVLAVQSVHAADYSQNLFADYGLPFDHEVIADEAVFTSYNKNGMAVNSGDVQHLYIDVPPGVVFASVAKTHESDSDSVSAVVAAPNSNEIAVMDDSVGFGKADGGVLYSGAEVQPGAPTQGLMVVTGPYVYSSVDLYYKIGSSAQAVADFNEWYGNNGGTTSVYVPPPTTAPEAPAPADSGEIHFGNGGDSTTTDTPPSSSATVSDGTNPLLALFANIGSQSNDEADAEPEEVAEVVIDEAFGGQTFTSGKSAVLERLIILAINDANINKVEGFKVIGDEFEIPIADGVSMKFKIDLNKIPETMDDIQEDSVVLVVSNVEGMENRETLIIQFETGGNVVQLELHPVVHQEGELITLIESIDGVFDVHSHDGWLIIVMDDGSALSLHLDLSHLLVIDQRAASNALELKLPVDYGYESNDVNGDGIEDVIVIHNGIAQLMLVKPNKP